MPRVKVENRVLANGRVNATSSRKVIGFVNDNKIHVVLDTNILIYGLEARHEGSQADGRQKACLEILNAWSDARISVGLNSFLFEEYSQITQYGIDKLLSLARESFHFRVFVDPPNSGAHKKDAFLFDGLSADYLVSENIKDVGMQRLKMLPPYKHIVKPVEFVRLI